MGVHLPTFMRRAGDRRSPLQVGPPAMPGQQGFASMLMITRRMRTLRMGTLPAIGATGGLPRR